MYEYITLRRERFCVHAMAENNSRAFRTSIGGQALIEGILMRGPEKQAIVVRDQDGNLVEKTEELHLVKERHPALGWPLVRGTVNFLDSMAQRYQEDVLGELPEVDGILGTGSYTDVATAVDAVMEGERPCRFGSIHTAEQEGDRILSTPPWYAYLRIAEGCDNHCAYCVIPSLRGKYRSRPLEHLLEEARGLADRGVKELIVIAQDITRYGTDLTGKHELAHLLRELCKLDFHWIRLHYLYPDEITDELIDTIAAEPKILKYIDLPIQHCNDKILKAMSQNDTHG